MNILIIIAIGFFVGLVARALLPGNDSKGFVITTILGIGGAMLANFFGYYVGWYQNGQPAGFIAAVIGAIGILIVYRLFGNGRAPSNS